MLTALFCVMLSSTANALDVGADIVVYAEKETVNVGDSFKVAVFVENIKSKSGVLGCDIPLLYNNKLLKIKSVEHVNPRAWGDMFLCLCDQSLSENPYNLRVACDHGNAISDSKYHVTESKEIGFYVTFTAVSTGKVNITVPENNDACPLFVVSGAGSNMTANGSSVAVNIVDEASTSSQEESESTSTDVSTEISDTEVSEESISEDISTPNVSTTESSQEESASASTEVSNEISEAITPSESSSTVSTEESEAVEADNDSDNGFGSYTLYIIIGVAAIVGIGTGLALWFTKRSDKKTDEELDD